MKPRIPPVLAPLAFALLSHGMISGAEGAENRPNILLLVSDDLGLQVGCYGDKVALTPNVDALAKAGALCSLAYVTQSSCSPSRATMLTGLYPHQHGQMGLADKAEPRFPFRTDIQTLPSILKGAGYRTGIIGKLHILPAKENLSFDYRNIDALLTLDIEKTARLMGEFATGSQGSPWFLMVNFFDPHIVPGEPDGFRIDVNGYPKVKVSPEQVPPFPWQGVLSESLRRRVAGYYTSVNRMDEGIGLALKKLEELGEADNTLVIFIGDNGPPFTRAKASCYEAGVREPLLFRWPGKIPAGTRIDSLISSVDLAPTILAATGAPAPANLPGFNLLPVLEQKGTLDRKYLVTEFTSHADTHFYPRRSITDGRWKLIINTESPKPNPLKNIEDNFPNIVGASDNAEAKGAIQNWLTPPIFELYDLSVDPDEFRNLASDPERREVMQGLITALKDWQQKTGDTLVLPPL